ncbi:anaphase-promoting complex, cyclosome, subunit 4-domain-containing protein [Parachaetomium inaequale]|uniref:Anaphase-promoting complex subunit 4 n=1 Tax=Parachaetomium inaequale TaxID=2588326 RepID=A0AAN6PPJ4_9PEZI|nr:anaphase-promoting complex, cyclosome, subunit 4-domain-containing protein [Parachaetomium inaequale]
MATDVPILPKLPLLGTTALSSSSPAAAGSRLACNPAIDLTATVGDAGAALLVWRSSTTGGGGDDGDQGLVSKCVERGRRVEGGVAWKADGQFVAAGWSDGVVRLVGLESSKAVHQIRVVSGDSGGGDAGKIGLIAWGRNVTGESGKRKGTDEKGGRQERRILLDGERTGDVAVDLPRELVFLEVETALPKLSPLPAGGSGDDMFLFSSTASLETVFRSCKAEDADDVHVMIVGTADGGIHLSINDSFVIGTVKHAPRGDGIFQLCGHGSRPEASTHMLLLRSQAVDDTALYLVPMNLTFLDHSPVNLSLLASKSTTLQNLLRYLKSAQSHMVSEWQSTRELPRRFMAGVEDDLKKLPNGDMTVVQALYHTVVTGHVFEPVKEWLVDTLGDRGHKRWEKTVVSGLTSLRGLVHGNFIPALERCGVILSRLLGIARFHGAEESIGFDEAQIKKLMDIVSCLMMVAHKVLTTVMDELEHFNAFAIWLRLEIDKQGSSSITEELSEKEATMDHPKVMSYIQYYLGSSPLALYFDEVAKEDYIKDQEMVGPGPSLIDLLDKQLQEQEAGRPYMKVLQRIGFLLNYLTTKANAVFDGIADAEKKGVKFGQATEVSVGKKIWKHDLWMGRSSKKDHSAAVFTAIASEDDKSKIYITRSDVPLDSAVSGPTSTRACGLGLPQGVVIVDFKYLDDKSLLVLCSQKGETEQSSEAAGRANNQPEEPRSVLLRIAYRSPHMPYQGHSGGQLPSVLELNSTGSEQASSCFAFSHMSGFTPIQMEVQRASKLRGEIPARVCLLGRDRAMYKTYALPEDLDDQVSWR